MDRILLQPVRIIFKNNDKKVLINLFLAIQNVQEMDKNTIPDVVIHSPGDDN